MTKDKAQRRGIVVVGDTLEQATGFFTAVAKGENVSVFQNVDGVQIATASAEVSGIQILDPLSGEELVSVDDQQVVIESLASALGQSVEAQFVQCTAGCNSYVMSDDTELLHKCPACASDLPDLGNSNVNENQNAAPGEKRESLLAYAGSFEEASQQFVAMVNGEVQPHTFQCDDVVVACASEMKFNIYQGVEAIGSQDAPVNMTAFASSAEGEQKNVPAHHFMCVSKACGTHVVASDESPLFCPGCSAGLIDPADIATASDDDDEDDEDEDFDDLAEDEEEEDESDEDDEDESFEDDEDEDDEDEAITLSVSSAKPSGVRKKEKATAAAAAPAAQPAAPEPLVSVAASFVALSSGEMKPENVDVAYAANIAGDSRWYAYHEGVPFAQALASQSKVENFSTDIFGRTFKAIAAENGVAVAMAELGFTEIKPEINVEKFVEAEVTSQVESRVAQIAEASSRDAAELNSRFLAAVATASQGINSGFYKGEAPNPIIAALASALEEAGITGGAALAAQCFARHGDAYHKALVAKASQIMQYDLTVQNQIAQAVADHQNPQGGETAVASSLPVGRPVGGLAQVGLQQETRETATAASQQVDDFAQRLGRLQLGRR